MPLLEFAFTAGLDQGTDPRRTVKMLTLDNYVWNKQGMIEKRPGYGTLPTLIYPLESTYSVTSYTIVSGGSGYLPAFFVYGSGGGGAGLLAIAGNSSGAVGAITIIAPLNAQT